jgi:RNA polymerase sigma-70 factor (ECF subfamily)
MQTAQLHVEADECVGSPSPHQEATQAFAHILSSELPLLYRRAYRLLGNAADAEDALQDALIAAYTHLDQFKGKSRMSTWMTTIVHNCARMQLRTRCRRLLVPLDDRTGDSDEQPLYEGLADHGPSPEHECSNSELTRRLKRVQRQLSPTLRRTFQLRDIDGLSIREAAHMLGVPTGTVKAQSSRARRKVLDLLRRTLKRQTRNHSGSTSTGFARDSSGHAAQHRRSD